MVTIVTLGFKFFKHLRPNNYLKKKKKDKSRGMWEPMLILMRICQMMSHV